MEEDIAVSVIMPCYNSSRYISKAIQSIFDQTFQDFELLVIDDGSTDDTSSKVLAFKDARLRYLKLDTNLGNYTARNKGIEFAKGRYLCMMDSDDISLPDRLELQFQYMETHPEVSILGGALQVIDENGKNIRIRRYPEEHLRIKAWLIANCWMAQPTLMMRHEIVKKDKHYFDENYLYAGDYEFFSRMSEVYELFNLSDILVKYRVHDAQISSSKKKLQNKFADSVRERTLLEMGMQFDEQQLSLHLKLMAERYIGDEELINAENWLNKLLDFNLTNHKYSQPFLYEILVNLLNVAARKNKLGG